MSRISIYLCIFAVLFFLGTVCYYRIKAYIKTKKEIKELKEALENQKKNLIYIVRHAKELAEINKERSKIDQEIAEAKSDEEVVDIINSIIDLNNNRVHHNTES